MKKPRIRIQIAALCFILLPAAAGVVAVNASATCQRFVRTYLTKPVRNRVSRTTAEAWAAWRIGHPNWKPNPKLHRPKYLMSREESVQKVDFACSVPLLPADMGIVLTADDVPPLIVNFPPMEATQISVPNDTPPEVAELNPQDEWPPLAPLVPPILASIPPGGVVPVFPIVPPTGIPPIPGPTPEPGSFLLVASGAGFMALFLARRNRAHACHAV
jgi:hypothetical protein